MEINILEQIVIPIIKMLFIVHLLVIGVMVMIWSERRVSGWIQDRLGPNRVGPQGLLQPIADGIKFLFKEDLIPNHVDKPLYVLAPAMLLIPAMIAVAVVPFGDTITIEGLDNPISLQIADINIGILYILAITSLGVYGVVIGAWASNNKYSLLGGLRSSAQMISYELTLGLAIIGVLMLSESLSLRVIAKEQGSYPWNWNFLIHFPAFLAFTTAMFAETNRLPFDLAEAEQELVAGYHTEYSSMKFAIFFMAEYMNMIVGSAVVVTLFLGGWHFFGLETMGGPIWSGVISFAIFFIKTGIFLFVFIWVRWTLPRFRYDQLMNFGWKFLLPVALTSIVVTGTLWVVVTENKLLWIGIGNTVAAFIVVSIVAGMLAMDNNSKAAAQDTSAAPLRGLEAIE
ncbi:NADH-quinone oxidoreductase subunit NuoH [Candidatus Poribacteria bacterium]|nr:NADH-quinone oxidoreductase subunit NuoH [Candidatus Poribacteria bacterium]MYF57053.1 NADH-quinone oxidoreductase subunit NuoH [Candidatus Poribacteria bacterium]MYI92839.1 NADH-quinone oxidoreductase subunit NuoH [Candidatus Poribacteria bacterium]